MPSPLSTLTTSPGTRWQALVFSSCRSTFSSPSPPTSRARGSWCAFGTPSGRSSSSSPSHSVYNLFSYWIHHQKRSIWREGARGVLAKRLLGSEQHQGEEGVAGGDLWFNNLWKLNTILLLTRCIPRHTVSWNSCLPVWGRDLRGAPHPLKNCQNNVKLYKLSKIWTQELPKWSKTVQTLQNLDS